MLAIREWVNSNLKTPLNEQQLGQVKAINELINEIGIVLEDELKGFDAKTAGKITGMIAYEIALTAGLSAAASATLGAATPGVVTKVGISLAKLGKKIRQIPGGEKIAELLTNGEFLKKLRGIDAPNSVGRLGRHADIPMDLRGAGLVHGSSRFAKLEKFLADRYGATIKWTDDVSFGMIDELTGTVKLNRATATFDVVAHELSHVRFAQAMGKWGNGKAFYNFEINLMESIGYWGTYRKGIASGLSHADALGTGDFSRSPLSSALQFFWPCLAWTLYRPFRFNPTITCLL